MSPIAMVLPLTLALSAASPAVASPMTAEWNLRFRHEQVSDDAFAHDASAETARLRLALRVALDKGFFVLLEGEGIASAGNDYNSGANGRTAWPGIADPSGAEINQALVGWRGTKFATTLGRQRINWDNQRWVGSVGWRQNEQTFDAASLEFNTSPNLTLRYAWLDRVHRVSGDDAIDPLARERQLDSHLFNAAFKHGPQQWTAYAYLHEDRDLATASSATYGLRWTGTTHTRWGWTAEVARQLDYADNPLGFAHSYWLVEPSLQAHGITWKLGWEHLGGDGHHALQTPLATLHAFNGWADKFTTTPAKGLDDSYLSVTGKAGKFAWTVAAHDYRADQGGQRYGQEFDLSIGRALGTHWNGLVKIADYRSDGFARDTRKIWLQAEYTGKLPR
jgi:hypothetical protein